LVSPSEFVLSFSQLQETMKLSSPCVAVMMPSIIDLFDSIMSALICDISLVLSQSLNFLKTHQTSWLRMRSALLFRSDPQKKSSASHPRRRSCQYPIQNLSMISGPMKPSASRRNLRQSNGDCSSNGRNNSDSSSSLSSKPSASLRNSNGYKRSSNGWPKSNYFVISIRHRHRAA